MKTEIIVYEISKNFDLYIITRLINSNFSKKLWKARIFTPTSCTELLA